MPLTLEEIEIQLKNRWSYPYKWFRKQNDVWDKHTNFIYNTPLWEELQLVIAKQAELHKLPKEEIFYYAINRWYNFWSAIAVEQVFCYSEYIFHAKNSKDRLIDFTIKGIPFDHKTSVFPRGFNKTYSFAKENKEELLYWLYKNQSNQQRQHFANRLFLIVYSKNGEHWKLKAEIRLLKEAISNYVSTFEISNLVTLTFENNQKALADIIWVEK
ncbi:MAG: hypothetical protein H0X63_00205 [Flavobacteriales bacterium]|jgi:hypothetical protein|nr:hypothetical protein [Flavobacteriales bacterium]